MLVCQHLPPLHHGCQPNSPHVLQVTKAACMGEGREKEATCMGEGREKEATCMGEGREKEATWL